MPEATEGRRPASPTARLRSLDGLRALAVLMVFAHHIDGADMPGGFIAVDCFFVLSGYLITALLLAEHDRQGRLRLWRFYARRVTRLYPALAVLVVVVTPIAIRDHLGLPWHDGLAALTFVYDGWWNYSGHISLLLHTWSLAVEEQFYVLWPVILAVCLARRWNPRAFVWISGGGSVLVTYEIYRAHDPLLSIIQILPTSHVPELAGGLLLALACQAEPGRALLRLTTLPVALMALVALLVAQFMLLPVWWAFPAGTLACWPLVAHLVLHRTSLLSRGFSNGPAAWLGRRSYGFYLWHFPIIVLLTRHGLHSYTEAAIALPAALMATVLSWQLVEQPMLRRYDALRARADGPIVSVEDPAKAVSPTALRPPAQARGPVPAGPPAATSEG